ncbi:hypothetical protein JCM3774_003105 [Rhodotorula dairenensis]
MPASTSTSRLAGLPRIPKVPKKAPKRKSASPPKPKTVPLPRPVPPRPAPLPVPAITLNPSDDDTLSDVSSSEDSDIIVEPAKPKATSAGRGKAKAVPPPRRPPPPPPPLAAANGLSRLSALPSLPALPPLPPLDRTAPTHQKASAPTQPPAAPNASTSASVPPTPLPPTPKPRSHKRKEVATPLPSIPSSSSTASVIASKPPVASTSATPKPAAPRTAASPSPAVADQAAYAPHHAGARSTPVAPQRMSLRQVLALSLQEAEEKAKSEPSTRENSPDATELGRVSAGSAANARRDRFEQAYGAGRHFGTKPAGSLLHSSRADKGKGKERLSDVSDLELAGDDEMSDLSSLSSYDDGADAIEVASSRRSKALEKVEERQIRAEVKRKQARRSADAMDLDRYARAGGDAEAAANEVSSDEDDLAQAWDRNVLALGRLHHRGTPDPEFGDGQAFFDDGEDSDLGVTEIPPGNGIGVVTWSDYEFDDEDEEDDDDEDDDADDEEDLLAAALADDDADPDVDEITGHAQSAAGDFENELEQLFALSEAVAGPINPDEYDLGNVWLEALSGEDGDGYDDESDDFDSDDEGDSDAEMIFGPDGELKRLFGRRRRHRVSAVEASGDDADESGESSTSDREDLEGARRGLALEDVRPVRPEDAALEEEALTAGSDSMDEATDSSCSDTDIYRYAPRTGALAAVQAPTTAELASLAPAAPSASSKPRVGKRKCHRHKAKSTLASIPERGSQPLPATQPTPRKGPVLGSFEPVQRQPEAAGTALKVVIVDENGPAPSPFVVPKKARRRLPDTPSRRGRSDSRVSTTSGTSGAESLDYGSNIGSPVLANVVFDLDFDSVLHQSLLADDDDDAMDVDTSSETEVDAAAANRRAGSKTPQALSSLSDLSRWARIPIGAFRSRTTGGDTAPALSQVLAAQAAELSKGKGKAVGRARAGASAVMLRDRKAAQSLNHTLGSPGQGSGAPSKRAIASRMLTSPVLAPTVRDPARPSMSLTRPTSGKKSKRSKSTTSKRALARDRSRTNSREPPNAGATAAASPVSSAGNLAAPTANLPPLHSPLFRSVSDHQLLEPGHLRLH